MIESNAAARACDHFGHSPSLAPAAVGLQLQDGGIMPVLYSTKCSQDAIVYDGIQMGVVWVLSEMIGASMLSS